MLNIKIAVVGPTKAGKTTISNFLADAGDNIGADYNPTIGCRILEMEQDLKINNRTEKTEIEIWDCSGDLKYESCWPALADDSNGIIFVLNPNESTHAKELNQWYTFFVKDSGMRDEVCLVISNRFTTEDGITGKGDAKLSNLFNEIKKTNANMDDESETFRNEFKNYLLKVASYTKSKQDQDEKMILR